MVFYCHFLDKLLANEEFVGGKLQKKNMGLMKTIYRIPMDWWEEVTTSNIFSLGSGQWLIVSCRTVRRDPIKFKLYSRRLPIVFPQHTKDTENSIPWNQYIRIRSFSRRSRPRYYYAQIVNIASCTICLDLWPDCITGLNLHLSH